MGGRSSLFRSLFAVPAARRRARVAESEGRLEEAVRLYLEADEREEAARVLLTLVDGSAEPAQRLARATQAAHLLADDHELFRMARLKRAQAAVALTDSGGALSPGTRLLLGDVASELDAIGAHAEAADIFRRLGDTEREARSLEAAGSVDELERLLNRGEAERKTSRGRERVLITFEDLVSQGRRREAVALAQATLQADASHDLLAERVRALRARIPKASGLAVRLERGRLDLVLGRGVVIGRGEGTVAVADATVSRRHLEIRREQGLVVVEPLSERGGVWFRGLAVSGPLPVRDEVHLTIGDGVPVALRPSAALAGAFDLVLAGRTYVVPLGPAALRHGWSLDVGEGGWPELYTTPASPAFAQGAVLAPAITLLAGDALEAERGGPAVLRIEE